MKRKKPKEVHKLSYKWNSISNPRVYESNICLYQNQKSLLNLESRTWAHRHDEELNFKYGPKTYFYYLPLYIKLHWCLFHAATVTIYTIPDNGPLNILMLWPHFLFPMMVAHQVFWLALVRPGGRFHHIPKKLKRLSPNIPPM